MDRQNIGKFSETVRDFAGPETQKDRAGERRAATPDRPGHRIFPVDASSRAAATLIMETT